jgi:hypothetical protein
MSDAGPIWEAISLRKACIFLNYVRTGGRASKTSGARVAAMTME